MVPWYTHLKLLLCTTAVVPWCGNRKPHNHNLSDFPNKTESIGNKNMYVLIIVYQRVKNQYSTTFKVELSNVYFVYTHCTAMFLV